MGVGQARDRDLVRLQLDPRGVRVGPRLERRPRSRRTRPGRRVIPTASTQPKPRSPGEGRDPAPVTSMSSGISRSRPLAAAAESRDQSASWIGRIGERARQPVASRPAPSPSASAIRAFGPLRCRPGCAPGPLPGRAAAGERVAGAGSARRAARREHDRDAIGHRRLRGREQRRRRVAGAGRGDDEAVGAGRDGSAAIGVPSVATVAVTRKTRSAARVVATCRRGPRRCRHEQHAARPIRPSGAAVEAPERVERRRVGLRHVVGGLDRSRRGRRPTPRSRTAASREAATRTASREVAPARRIPAGWRSASRR